MKKSTKRLLSIGLSLALAASIGGGLVACGGDNNDGKPDKKPKAVPYWLAGKIQGVDGWGADDGSGVVEAHRFSKTEDAKKYEINIDLWKGDTFKVRYEGKGWGAFQLNYDNSYDATQKADEDAKIGDGDGYPNEHNFGVMEEGNYTIKLDLSGENPVVSYEYKGPATVKAPKPVDYVSLNETSISLAVDDTFKLIATVDPADADDPTVTWESSDEEVATVDDEGNVTAVGVGTATITAYAGEEEATCEVTVASNLIAVETITLNKEATSLHVGGQETLVATVTPNDATGTVGYSSSAPTVVSVDATGKITALLPGTATITAAQGGKSATCEVTVVADYCLVGQSKSAAFEEKAWVANYAGVSAVPTGILFEQDEEDATKYSLEVDLYEGDEFKIITAGIATGGWDAVSVLAASEGGVKLLAASTEDTPIACIVSSSSKNIGVADDGKYLITFTIPATGDPTLTYKYVGPAAAVVETEKDIYIKGAITSLGQTGWKHNFSNDYKLTYNSETKEYTIDLEVTAEDAENGFGFAQYGHTDDHSGDDVDGGAWIGRDNLGTDGDANDKFGASGDFTGVTPGTYRIVIKSVDGVWVVNFYTATAQD